MEKLNILLKKRIISKEIFSLCKNIFFQIQDWNENDKNRFLIHLAIALNRIQKSQKVDSLSQIIVDQLKAHPKLFEAETILKKWLNSFSYKLPKNEKWFLIMHIINYLERNQKQWK